MPADARALAERWIADFEPASRGPLYKYLNIAHARALLTRGAVRVGTLAYYRSREGADPLRGDRGEGEARFVAALSGAYTYDELPQLARDVVRGEAGEGSVFIHSVFIGDEIAPNSYVYCMARELSRRAAGSYTACVEIPDPQAFVNRVGSMLAYRLGVRAVNGGFGPVMYADRTLSHHFYGVVGGAFLKEPRYSCECEARATWFDPPPGGELYLDLEDTRLASLVRPAVIPGPGTVRFAAMPRRWTTPPLA
jgi:hypothetical protein